MSGSSGKPLVLGILGSPRPRSNTGVLLQRVLAGAVAAGAESEFLDLRKLNYVSCRHCGGCDKTGRCVVRDDVQMIHSRIRAAQHLMLASPIQFSAVSGETKMMIDRAQAFWVAKYRLHLPLSEVPGPRRGVFVATCGGDDERVFDWAKHTVKAFFNSTGFQYRDELFEADTDRTPPVTERESVLARADELGRRLVTTP
jgi:NAD(P)H-dependent FMN reductase